MRGRLVERLKARLGQIEGRSVRDTWTGKRVAKAIPTRPVPAPSSRMWGKEAEGEGQDARAERHGSREMR